MLFQDNTTPRARHWAMPFMVGGIALVWAILSTGNLQLMLYVVTVVFFSWALVNFGHHVGSIIVSLLNQSKDADFLLSENFKLKTMASMSEFQIKALRAGYHIVGRYPSTRGNVIEKLADEEVYLYTVWYILCNSTSRNVYPINNFQVDTYHFDMIGDHSVSDYQQARNFHTWLVRYGYAYWGNGNQSASWKKDITPDVVLMNLGLDRDSYKETSDE